MNTRYAFRTWIYKTTYTLVKLMKEEETFPLHPFDDVGNAAFRLACCSSHCHFDGDICTTAQVPHAAEGRPSGKQHLANRSITLQLCPQRQTTDSWILFNSGAMLLGDKAKAAWPLRAATLKQQAMITWRSSKAVSGKLVWNQHNTEGGWIYYHKKKNSIKTPAVVYDICDAAH